ncbi:MAG TPA: carbamoyltransferase C-terminal domain-containing protein [Kofleriaceae bacterium]|jgi:carbamoyltransferase|nr:carbamoyltransferase C-terminal domain-containing protein [Kofleriaceae bacterium]
MRAPWILGISASHNGAYCLLHGDELVVAIQDERLVRRKRSRVYGARSSIALRYCLEAAGIGVGDLSMIALSAQGANDSADNDLTLHPELRPIAHRVPITYVPHHLAHAMSAFATSGFTESAVLVIDGLGSPWADLRADERAVARGAGMAALSGGWEVLSTYRASDRGLEPLDKHLVADGRWLVKHPDTMWGFRSLGGMFSAVSEQLFGDPMEAGKVMGLAPYGQASLPAGAFCSIADGLLTFHDDVPARFPHRDRWPNHEHAYADLAASTQAALEVAVLAVAARLRTQTSSPRLCYAGGVALNGITNQRLLRDRVFDELHIIPAAEDSGVAIGAAYLGLAQLTGEVRGRRQTRDATGRSYSRSQIDDAIAHTPAIEVVDPGDLLATVVDWLCRGEIGGWFEGGSELGPRALGQRSILCDPTRADAKDVLNRRVKGREAFRPFAPAVAAEHVDAWFELEATPAANPFMLRVCSVRPELRDRVPGVVHVDGTGRLQSVERGSRFHGLLEAFQARTGVPMLINTSFNVMGEPIVETPEDALWCMLSTGIDFCVLEDRLVRKQPTFRSLLELVPRVIAKRCRVDLTIDDGALHLKTAADLQVQVATPWGDVEQPVSADQLRVLQAIDGRTTGAQLLAGPLRGVVDADQLVRALGLLRRLRVIALSAPA